MHAPLAYSVIVAAFLSRVSCQALSSADVEIVTSQLALGAKERYPLFHPFRFTAPHWRSWELGTRAQALLELYAANFSVFDGTVPPPTTIPSNTTSAIAPVFSIAHNTVSALKNNTGPGPLISGDGAAGDPASLGVAVLLANWTGQGAGMFPLINMPQCLIFPSGRAELRRRGTKPARLSLERRAPHQRWSYFSPCCAGSVMVCDCSFFASNSHRIAGATSCIWCPRSSRTMASSQGIRLL